MPWWDDFRFRFRALFRRSTVERELDEELQFHIERQATLYRNAGLSAEEALRRAPGRSCCCFFGMRC